MYKMKKHSLLLILVLFVCTFLAGQSIRTKIMNFENPGNRRILKTEEYSHWYYRSLPEKTLKLNVEGVEKLELRSFGIEALRKPQITLIINKKKTTYDLKVTHRLEGYYMYEPLVFEIPEGTKSLELLCYPRSIYMRPFQMITIKPKPKKVVIPNLELKAHAGMIDVSHNSTTNEYFSFNPTQSFKFRINNQRDADLYIRVQLTDRSVPIFALYKNGEKVQSFEFGLSRTIKYSATGVRYLSIGKKLNLLADGAASEYELRAESDHLFMARPVILKKR
ncbi:MAG: hypothetical protein PHC50_03250 [Candidatus Cloacimonetes bacterium]|nr:hypothetical protein [Candidatus Cloacimonadota bacterium]